MQKISRSNRGVTLIALIITIIVMIIILGVTLNSGLMGLNDVANRRIESELGIVQEAIMQRYALLKSSNQLEIIPSTTVYSNITLPNDTERPSGLIGTRLYSSDEVSKNGFDVNLLNEYTPNDKIPFEKYYYLLTEEDLLTLGVKKGDNKKLSDDYKESYIVNYFTGEVFNISNKTYFKTNSKNNELVYTQPTDVGDYTKNYDFNDD